ncbi:ABC transporter permease [Thiohalomonas denitrificans]|uniref:Transport permease protein n=1 Tax=Thiohalomonas denitrificans TaxID=415747 RepID=A0A1G5QMX1_9GAMM|nr:ABC transporter permease [Thiohalomonas denitrificans]SCZ62958.1 ABC-2 type transport system permease protein [Thiohalomonas denitrificans]
MIRRTELIAFKTIVVKEIRRFRRIWPQTILPPMVTTALYFIIFGGLIGSRIGPMQGLSYMEYIVPGVIMLGIITNSYANVVSSFFGAKFQRFIEELLIAPVPNYMIVLGYVAGGMARGLSVGLMVTLVAAFFVDLEVHSWFITLSTALLTALLFAIGGFINAVYAKSFDDIAIIPTFVLTPLTYLGGIFFTVEMLPGFWQNVALFNPILYIINAFRYGLLGVSDIDVGVAFGIIGLFIVALFSFALYLLHKGIGVRS